MQTLSCSMHWNVTIKVCFSLREIVVCQFMLSLKKVAKILSSQFCARAMSSQELKDWLDEKERLKKLSLNDRRSHYFCSDNFTTINQIPTWKTYYLENEKALSEKVSEKDWQRFKEEHGNTENGLDLADKVSIYRGDITKLEIDAIVNAANESLLGGGGVDGAIHRGAGKKLLEECRSLNGCQTGGAKITCGYKLPAKNVIHTVGPIGEESSLLSKCYANSLALMLSNRLRTIAFPCISTGVYGYPSVNAAPVAIEAVKNVLVQEPDKIDRVIFCLFLDKDVEIYEKQLQLFFPVKK